MRSIGENKVVVVVHCCFMDELVDWLVNAS